MAICVTLICVEYVSGKRLLKAIFRELKNQVGKSMTFITDPIADLVVRIKNAGAVNKKQISVPYSKLKHAVADALVRAGFVSSVEKEGKGTSKVLIITLAYTEGGKPKIEHFKRVSKPGRRLYKSVKEIYPVKQGRGIAVYSTPKGVLVDTEAKKENVGGEILFEVF